MIELLMPAGTRLLVDIGNILYITEKSNGCSIGVGTQEFQLRSDYESLKKVVLAAKEGSIDQVS